MTDKTEALDDHRHKFDRTPTAEDEVLVAFQKDGPTAIAWGACAARRDTCGKRRKTYQLKPELDFQSNDRLCVECLITQACAERRPAEPQQADRCTRCQRPLSEHFLGCC